MAKTKKRCVGKAKPVPRTKHCSKNPIAGSHPATKPRTRGHNKPSTRAYKKVCACASKTPIPAHYRCLIHEGTAKEWSKGHPVCKNGTPAVRIAGYSRCKPKTGGKGKGRCGTPR
jgi:hypothetical protein